MNQPNHFPASLRDVAVLSRSTFCEQRSVCQDVSIIDQGYSISLLARQLRGVDDLERALVFPTFFTPAAVELLMALPNHFWFWNVVYYAVGESRGSTLIDDSTVLRVFKRFRDRCAAFYDLNKPVDQLTAYELAVRVAEGVILFKNADWQHLNGAELVFNLMFQQQQSEG